jgi:hypothetical protein
MTTAVLGIRMFAHLHEARPVQRLPATVVCFYLVSVWHRALACVYVKS